MKKPALITSLSLAAFLAVGGGIGAAVAVGDNPDPTPGQILADYMGDDNDAQWDKVQTWVEAEYGDGATVPTEPTPDPTPEPTTPPTEPTPKPTPTEDPTEAPSGIETGEVKWTETGVTFTGKIHGTAPGDRVQLRTDTKELTGQRGFYEYEEVAADGTVSFTLADYTTPQDTLHWHIAIGGSELEYGNVVATGEVNAPESPTPPGPALTGSTVTATADNKIVLQGKVTGTTGQLTFRASANALTGQAGYIAQGTPAADGTLRLEVTDFNNTDPKFWQLETGGTTSTYGQVFAKGDVTQGSTPTPSPTPTTPTTPPTTPPATGEGTTGGSGGAPTNRLNQTFASGGLTSNYHIYAAGLDYSKPVGILMYGDGSGGFGFDSPSANYLLGGTNGLVAVAKKHNLILVVPNAPAPNCDGYDNCWYNGSGTPTPVQKAAWSSALMDRVKGQYDIDNSRVVTGGYSSGAQWHRWFLPAHAEKQSVDLSVMIAYGGAPAVSTNYSAAYKDDLTLVWDTGKDDEAYSTASYGAVGGYNWYTNAGFTTEPNWPDGVGHARDGQFGAILDREITQHLR